MVQTLQEIQTLVKRARQREDKRPRFIRIQHNVQKILNTPYYRHTVSSLLISVEFETQVKVQFQQSFVSSELGLIDESIPLIL
jgi:hypothetical protein